MIEVEVKVAISEEEKSKLVEEMRSLCPSERVHEEEEEDIFFVSSYDPSFGIDKTLKLRRSSDRTKLIFKNKRAMKNLKGNVEVEVGIEKGSEDNILCLLRGLGFRESVVVKKKRTSFHLDGCTVNLDDVMGLGSFLEVEVLVDENEVDKAYQRIASVLSALGLSHKKPILKGYAEMLTAQEV